MQPLITSLSTAGRIISIHLAAALLAALQLSPTCTSLAPHPDPALLIATQEHVSGCRIHIYSLAHKCMLHLTVHAPLVPTQQGCVALSLSMLYACCCHIRSHSYCGTHSLLSVLSADLLPITWWPTGDGSASGARNLSQAASGPLTSPTGYPVTTAIPWAG